MLLIEYGELLFYSDIIKLKILQLLYYENCAEATRNHDAVHDTLRCSRHNETCFIMRIMIQTKRLKFKIIFKLNVALVKSSLSRGEKVFKL